MADHRMEPEPGIADVDVAVAPVGGAVGASHVLREDAPRLDAAGDVDAHVALQRAADVVRAHRAPDSDGRRLVAAARVERAGDLALLVEDVPTLLDPARGQHAAIHAEQVLAVEAYLVHFLKRADRLCLSYCHWHPLGPWSGNTLPSGGRKRIQSPLVGPGYRRSGKPPARATIPGGSIPSSPAIQRALVDRALEVVARLVPHPLERVDEVLGGDIARSRRGRRDSRRSRPARHRSRSRRSEPRRPRSRRPCCACCGSAPAARRDAPISRTTAIRSSTSLGTATPIVSARTISSASIAATCVATR